MIVYTKALIVYTKAPQKKKKKKKKKRKKKKSMVQAPEVETMLPMEVLGARCRSRPAAIWMVS